MVSFILYVFFFFKWQKGEMANNLEIKQDWNIRNVSGRWHQTRKGEGRGNGGRGDTKSKTTCLKYRTSPQEGAIHLCLKALGAFTNGLHFLHWEDGANSPPNGHRTLNMSHLYLGEILVIQSLASLPVSTFIFSPLENSKSFWSKLWRDIFSNGTKEDSHFQT